MKGGGESIARVIIGRPPKPRSLFLWKRGEHPKAGSRGGMVQYPERRGCKTDFSNRDEKKGGAVLRRRTLKNGSRIGIVVVREQRRSNGHH